MNTYCTGFFSSHTIRLSKLQTSSAFALTASLSLSCNVLTLSSSLFEIDMKQCSPLPSATRLCHVSSSIIACRFRSPCLRFDLCFTQPGSSLSILLPPYTRFLRDGYYCSSEHRKLTPRRSLTSSITTQSGYTQLYKSSCLLAPAFQRLCYPCDTMTSLHVNSIAASLAQLFTLPLPMISTLFEHLALLSKHGLSHRHHTTL